MQTAARAVTSSASSTSSAVKPAGCAKRVKTATPSAMPRARIGTDIVEWMPSRSMSRTRPGSQANHFSMSPDALATTIACPVSRATACGEAAG